MSAQRIINLEERDKFLDTYDIPKSKQENISLNRPIRTNKTEAVIESPMKTFHLGLRVSHSAHCPVVGLYINYHLLQG